MALSTSTGTDNLSEKTYRLDRLFDLANDQIAGRARGFGGMLLWHLALRRYPWAMVEAARITGKQGRMADPFSPLGLAYRAYRAGNATAAYNFAMGCFNANDLQGYRMWLRRAARLGDGDAKAQLRRFETRLPHTAAREIRRHRPSRRYD